MVGSAISRPSLHFKTGRPKHSLSLLHAVPLLLPRDSLGIISDLAAHEPHLDAKAADLGPQHRRGLVRPLVQDGRVVLAKPRDDVALGRIVGYLSQVRQRQQRQLDLGRAGGGRVGGRLGDVVDELEGRQEGAPEALDAGVAELGRVDVAHQAEVVGRAVGCLVADVVGWVEGVVADCEVEPASFRLGLS